jgi:hypothetical protein
MLPVTYAPLFSIIVFSSSGLGCCLFFLSFFVSNRLFHGGLVVLMRFAVNNFWFLLMEIGGNPLLKKNIYSHSQNNVGGGNIHKTRMTVMEGGVRLANLVERITTKMFSARRSWVSWTPGLAM